MRLLVVGDYNRRDFISLFECVVDNAEIFFLEFSYELEVKNAFFEKYGKNIFWKDFSDAYDLLEKIKPNKVIFLFIESYNHIALNVACRKKKIRTYHLEHGFRSYKISKYLHANKTNINKETNIREKAPLYVRIKTSMFFWRTVFKSKLKHAFFLFRFYLIRSRNNGFVTLKKLSSCLTVPEVFISFSPAIYEQHKVLDAFRSKIDVHFIGIPYFDRFAQIKSNKDLHSRIALFIDHPHSTKQIFGWNKENKEKFIAEIIDICKKNKFKLLVKPHPSATVDKDCWSKMIDEDVKIVDEKDLVSILPEVKIIFGFYSTLLLPLLALEHTVGFTFENHPSLIGKEFYLSEHLKESGVSNIILNTYSLHSIFENLEHFKNIQGNHKQSFIAKWMYKFDGRSGERLRNVLLMPNED